MNTSFANIVAPDCSLGDESRIFVFEADFADDLRCIPMAVRFKLDRVGIKLSLKQWAKIGAANRQALLHLRCDTNAEIANYSRKLIDQVTHCSSEPVVNLPLDTEPAWANSECVPEQVGSRAATAGLTPPSLAQWTALSVLERFALFKLARSNHDNHNFAPAMREFGLAAPAVDKPPNRVLAAAPKAQEAEPGSQ